MFWVGSIHSPNITFKMQLIQKLRGKAPLPMALREMTRTHSQNVLTRRASMTTSLASSSPSITLRSIRSSDLLRLSTSNSFFCNANWRRKSIQNYSWKSDGSPEVKHGGYRTSISNTGRRKPAVSRGSLASRSSLDKLQANERTHLYKEGVVLPEEWYPRLSSGLQRHVCVHTCTFTHLNAHTYKREQEE